MVAEMHCISAAYHFEALRKSDGARGYGDNHHKVAIKVVLWYSQEEYWGFCTKGNHALPGKWSLWLFFGMRSRWLLFPSLILLLKVSLHQGHFFHIYATSGPVCFNQSLKISLATENLVHSLSMLFRYKSFSSSIHCPAYQHFSLYISFTLLMEQCDSHNHKWNGSLSL